MYLLVYKIFQNLSTLLYGWTKSIKYGIGCGRIECKYFISCYLVLNQYFKIMAKNKSTIYLGYQDEEIFDKHAALLNSTVNKIGGSPVSLTNCFQN